MVMSYFKVVSQYFLEILKKTTKKLSQDSRSPSQHLNVCPPEYEAAV
jgi:hypothetical protein